MKINKLSIIIPAFNEGKYISKILTKVKDVDLGKIKKEIIVVDDGSTDNSVSTIKKNHADVILIVSKQNKGKAHAIKLGLKKCTGDVVIIQDADLEYEPNDYKELLKPFIENDAEVVYGSRILNKENGKFSQMYYWGGRFLSLFTSILYGVKITDEPTGYKLFKKGLLEDLDLQSNGFEFCPEVTAKILKRKIKIHEVPIHYYPRSRSEGKKIKAVKDGLLVVWTLIKYRF